MAEPLAIAFANTRTSITQDRIATVEQFRKWCRPWPALAGQAAVVRKSALRDICAQRDATQLLLHALADGSSPVEKDLERATRYGLEQAAFRLRPAEGVVNVERHGADAVAQLLGRAVVDFLLSPELAELRRCQGADCRKIFTSARVDRRWCDSRICGNRARVAAYARRRG